MRWKLFALVVLATWLVAVELGGVLVEFSEGQHRSPDQVATPALGSPAALIESHGCWTDTAPPDVVVPGHVVVTQDGRTWYAGPRVVGLALDQVFGDVDHDLIVHAFCR